MTTYPELWVLRHGETEWNAEERLQGHLDSALTPTGLAQARAQGDILARAGVPKDARVLSSPSPRALRTAEIAVNALGLPIETDPRLMEIDLGQWQGMTLAELRAANPSIRAAPDPHLWKFLAPGGETLGQMAARVEALLDELTGPSVLVTHGVTSRLLRCIVLGRASADLSSVPGGQGVVHHLRDGSASILTA